MHGGCRASRPTPTTTTTSASGHGRISASITPTRTTKAPSTPRTTASWRRWTGTYLFGATLLYKVNASTTEIRGSLGEISATLISLATAIWLQTMVPLTAGDTVELREYYRVADGYFAADHTSFWGCKIG